MKTFVVDHPTVDALRALNYAPEIERIRDAGSSSARPLRAFVREFGPAYGSVFTRRDCAPEHGVELITQGDMFAAEPTGRVIRRDSMPHPHRHLVTRGQILIAGAGTLGENELYGRSIIADARLVGKYVGPHSMSLHFEDPEDDFTLFAYAWLASPTGVMAIRSTSYGTKILGLRKDLLGSLPVPIPPRRIVTRVADLIRRAMAGREQYLAAVQQARRIVQGIPEIDEALRDCTGRTRRSVIWSGPFPTLCAWNFAAGGRGLQTLRRRWVTRLRDVVKTKGIFLGPRSTRVPCSPPHGVQLYSQRDVFLIRPIGQRISRLDMADRLLFVPDEALLVAANGQTTEGSLFGRVELATFFGRGAAMSGHLMRMLPKPGWRDSMYGFLSTSLGQWLLKSTAVGTSVPSMRIDLLEDLPFPDPDRLAAAELSKTIREAELARLGAATAENDAIEIVETEVLPQWLA